ncbi:MAG: outer membrane protein assembly factor BamA [Magnetococcales bacterium]|nr:outer membrane protein assembly factor BamA [Magnetococcales bacterium]
MDDKRAVGWVARMLFLLVGFAVLTVLPPRYAQAETVRSIKVEGSQRIEPETVFSYLALKKGDTLSRSALRKSIRALYGTGFFRDISLEMVDDGVLVVRVIENAMINQVSFEGTEAFSDEELNKIVQQRSYSIYNRAKSEQDLLALQQAYRIKGLFLADINMMIQPLDQNRIDLVYRVREGERSRVRQVNVVGNSELDDDTLLEDLTIQPTGWFSFFSEDDVYDRDKLMFDQSQIRNNYLDNGYVRVKVLTSVAELTPDRESFIITHTVNEGERYRIGSVEIQTDFDELPESELRKEIEVTSGEWYDRRTIRNSIQNLRAKVGDYGYAQLRIQPNSQIDDDKKVVNLTFQIAKGRRVYVDRIEISGNSRTRDEVIRREIRLMEGDRFSVSKLRRSKTNLERLSFFEKVEILTPPSPEGEDRVNLHVNVSEQPTGSFTIGAGFSTTEKMIGTASVSQNNFLGRGQRLSLSMALSARTTHFDISFTEPFFMGRRIGVGFDLFNKEIDESSTSSFEQSIYGTALRVSFPLSDYLKDTISYRFTNVDITDVGTNPSLVIQEQAARSPYNQSMISNTIRWSNLDDPFLPTKGRIHRLTTDFSGIGGDVHFLRLLTEHSFYHTLIGKDDLVGHIRGRFGVVEGLSEDVPIFERFHLGGPRSLRGFSNGGVGPRTLEGDAFGGTHLEQINAELIFPFFGLGEKGVRGLAFLDMGMLGDFDTIGSGVRQEDSLRMSTGFGVHWNSPFGPLRFTLGFPLSKEDYDKTRSFEFSIGTAL